MSTGVPEPAQHVPYKIEYVQEHEDLVPGVAVGSVIALEALFAGPISARQ